MKQLFRRHASLLAVVCAFLSLATVVFADGEHVSDSFHSGGKRKHPPKIPYTAIASVDTNAMTITVEPKNSTATGTKTYKFTPKTVITVSGQPGTVANLTPGQQIHIGTDTDETIASELKVTPPPADPEYTHATR